MFRFIERKEEGKNDGRTPRRKKRTSTRSVAKKVGGVILRRNCRRGSSSAHGVSELRVIEPPLNARHLLRHRTTSWPSLNPFRLIREECGPKMLTAGARAPRSHALRGVKKKKPLRRSGQSLGPLSNRCERTLGGDLGARPSSFLEHHSRPETVGDSQTRLTLATSFPSDANKRENTHTGKNGHSSSRIYTGHHAAHRGTLLGSAARAARNDAFTD